MLAYGEKQTVRDDLLAMTSLICQRQSVIPVPDQKIPTVWWGNTNDFSPGVGVVARLNSPIGTVGAHAIQSLMITYHTEGEASIMVGVDADPELFEDDNGLACHVRDIFKHYVGKSATSSVGTWPSMKPSDLSPFDYLLAEEKVSILLAGGMQDELIDPSGGMPVSDQPSQLIVPDFHISNCRSQVPGI